MNEKLIASPSPHIQSGKTTREIMLDVIIALFPAFIASIVLFGIRSIFIVFVTVASCFVTEYICRKIMKRENTTGDLSAVVTGILLAFNLPVSINPFIAAFGGVIAIVVVKQMFGGIGDNFVNPAIAARIILMISFPVYMTKWTPPFTNFNNIDSITTATILSSGKGNLSYFDLFMGNKAGCLGETCALALIIGGIYLIARKVISPVIPVCFISTVMILTFLFGQNPLVHLLSGGLLLGAIFMATDYVTSPITFKGKIIFGIGCGLITALIRVFGDMTEGVSFAIILMNIMTPLIEKVTKPRKFGERGVTVE